MCEWTQEGSSIEAFMKQAEGIKPSMERTKPRMLLFTLGHGLF